MHTTTVSSAIKTQNQNMNNGISTIAAAIPGADLTQPLTPSTNQQARARSRKGFLDLPPEIRNTIYSLLFGKDLEIIIRPMYSDRQPFTKIDILYSLISEKMSGKPLSSSDLNLNILSTCSFIHGEASPILYGANTFEFNTPDVLEAFARRIGYYRKAELRHLTLDYVDDRDMFRRAMNQVQDMVALQKIELREDAIQRFTAKDMAEDLRIATLGLWKYEDRKDEVTMENIVDIFCFADHTRISYSRDDGWAPLWGVVDRGGELEDAKYDRRCERRDYLNLPFYDSDSEDSDDERREAREVEVDTWNADVRQLLLEDLWADEYEDAGHDVPYARCSLWCYHAAWDKAGYRAGREATPEGTLAADATTSP